MKFTEYQKKFLLQLKDLLLMDKDKLNEYKYNDKELTSKRILKLFKTKDLTVNNLYKAFVDKDLNFVRSFLNHDKRHLKSYLYKLALKSNVQRIYNFIVKVIGSSSYYVLYKMRWGVKLIKHISGLLKLKLDFKNLIYTKKDIREFKELEFKLQFGDAYKVPYYIKNKKIYITTLENGISKQYSFKTLEEYKNFVEVFKKKYHRKDRENIFPHLNLVNELNIEPVEESLYRLKSSRELPNFNLVEYIYESKNKNNMAPSYSDFSNEIDKMVSKLPNNLYFNLFGKKYNVTLVNPDKDVNYTGINKYIVSELEEYRITTIKKDVEDFDLTVINTLSSINETSRRASLPLADFNKYVQYIRETDPNFSPEKLSVDNPHYCYVNSNSSESTLYKNDTTYFRILVRKSEYLGGCIDKDIFKNKKLIKENINGYKVVNFKSDNNNCFLEILKYIKNLRNKSDCIRKKLNIELGIKIGFNEIRKIEEHYDIKFLIVTDCINKKVVVTNGYPFGTEIDNLNRFETKTLIFHHVIYGDINNEVSIDCENGRYVVLLKNEHYYLVEQPEFTNFCKISGNPISNSKVKDTKANIIKYLIDSNRLKNKETKNKDGDNELKEIEYYFFDYETIYYEDGELNPYSVACVKYINENNEFKEVDRFFMLDSNCTKYFVEWLFDKEDPTKDNILIGYNSSRFDNNLLLDYLISINCIDKNTLFLSNGCILGLKFKSFRSIDLCKFLSKKLDDALAGILATEKKKEEFDHKFIQKTYEEHGIEYLINNKELYEKIKSYNINDCTVLADLYKCVRDTILIITEEDINYNLTSPGLIHKAAKKTEGFKKVAIPKDYETWKFIRRSVIAGRSECFKRGQFFCQSDNQIGSFDCKSLYPFVMISEDCPYPSGKEVYTERYIEGKLGIYNVTVQNQPKDNIIPLRLKDKPLNWKYQGDITCELNTIDIECLKKYGANVIVHHGYYWEEQTTEVFDVMRKLKNFKTKQDEYKSVIAGFEKEGITLEEAQREYSSGKRELSKLLLNALSGKMAQRIHETSSSLITSVSEQHSFEKSHSDLTIKLLMGSQNCIFMSGKKNKLKYEKTASPCHIASFIYGYARRHMYEALISRVESKMQMDTDSLHFYHRDLNNLSNKRGFGEFLLGGEFGDFENELTEGELKKYEVEYEIALAPKCYMFQFQNKENNDIKKYKYRFKGIGYNDRIFGNNDIIIKDYPKYLDLTTDGFNKLSIEEKCEYFSLLTPALSPTLYLNLLNSNKVKVIQGQIKKCREKKVDGEKQSKFFMQQIYMIKELSL